MTVEAPADSWYTWVGVVLVSVAVAGVVAGLPAEPPPDASGAANTVDRVAASERGTSVSHEVDADQARIGTKQLAFRNDGGTTQASIAFGTMTPVDAADGPVRDAGEALLAGAHPEEVIERRAAFETERDLRAAFDDLRTDADRRGVEWQETNGRVLIRSVQIAGEQVVLVGT
ncbi:hypothetical protein GRX03_10170 [Halovenus sp. WSH3]|uniref:Uncharacterized protein n=1 Tax=Halovenus carboxidivorans TaxID=2692199 RepID=A0A6B0T8R8_9EURY|nr:hypothetical protein [Halovenus carboxidivorans]MXR51963.1 hypothetical protein [Halovenus carboxidivorans]